jgi:REP element-mobilizing transposase RayT
MRPSPSFNEIFLGTLGYAQAKYDLELHAFAALSNHYHLLCSPRDSEQLSDCMRLFNSKLAREIGRLHDWREKVWSRRFRPIRVSDEDAAQVGRLVYVLSHGCKEGLVSSPKDWPGPSCVRALLEGSPLNGMWFDRTAEFKARRAGLVFGIRDFGTEQPVILSPLPCWRHLSTRAYRDRVAEIVVGIESETRLRQLQTGRQPIGRDVVLRQNPHDLPVRSKRSPAPAVHAASKEGVRGLIESYREFVAAYRRAAEKLREGAPPSEFPSGSFPPRWPFVE